VNILVFNCGSSSLSYKIFEVSGDETAILLAGKAHRVGVTGSEPSFIENKLRGTVEKETVPIADHRGAAALALKYILAHKLPVDCVGHRFVHGGEYFRESAFVDAASMENLVKCLPLAPIHNPMALSAIRECRATLPETRQYVTFDSAFHSAMPAHAYTYALPRSIIERFGFRKYGFHGLSYTYVTGAAARRLGRPLEKLRLIACHLGTGGSSVAAVRNGRSIDTSMGYSPLQGLVMSTRSGDIDPMLTVYLMAVYGYRPDDLLDFLNKKSGLLGISGFSSDIRDIIGRMEEGDERPQADLAFSMYVQRLKKYIGSYVAALGGADALIFTDDIGVRNPHVRERVCAGMEWCGIRLDPDANAKAPTDAIACISAPDSPVAVLSVPTEEELLICREGARLLGGAR